MGILGTILGALTNYHPPAQSGISNAVATQRAKDKNAQLDKQRESQKKAWQDALNGPQSADPVGKFVTDNAIAMQNSGNEGSSGEYYDEYGNYIGNGSGSSAGGLGGGTGTGTGQTEKPKASMSEEEKKALEAMPYSNIPRSYKQDENDLMYRAATQKQDSYWQLKEEIFIYTIHDKEKHRYITSLQIDSDKDDIVTSCQVMMPFDQKLMEYWIPGKTVFMIIGGTFDREVLFIGRVSEVNQMGDEIQVVGQNIGWKFKQYMSTEFSEKIQTLPVTLAVKAIFKELGFEKGKYYIDLWGIPDVDSYTLDENGTVVHNGETVMNVPELTDVVKGLKKSDMSEYVAKKSTIRETQAVADDYDKHVKLTRLDAVIGASKSYTPSQYRQSFGIKASEKKGEIEYDPIEDRIFGSDKNFEYFIEDKSSDSEYTYEDILHNIASAIDAHFYIVDTTVCFVSFNALMAMGGSLATQKAIQPRIEFWQMMDDSYELDVNQYGYYNTVIIKYKNGQLKRSYDDLVRVYSEVPITYEEPDLDYAGAQLKAQAYLAAHVRDFGMEIKATILYSGKIIPSSFVKVLNPLTMSESLLYVFGTSIQWDASNQTLLCDLDMRFGPENPDNPEVPEVGLGYSSGGTDNSVYSGGISANISEAAKQMIGGATDPTIKAQRIYNWVDANVTYESYSESKYSTTQVLQGKKANCWDTAMLIYDLCTAVGVKCEVHNGYFHFATSGSIGHLWNKIEQNGQMVFADTGRTPNNPIGSLGGGYIESDSLMKKNY